MSRRTVDRGLHHRRTRYRPELTVCHCTPCQEEADRRRRDRLPITPGEPFAGCEFVNREEVIAEEWEAECVPIRGTNYGHGVLQDLMFVEDRRTGSRAWERARAAFVITPQERVIVATVIQWLGSNVGWSFLERCVERCGFRLVPIEDRPPRPRPPSIYTASRLAHPREESPS